MFDCSKCEEVLQPYLDGVLSDEQHAEAERHLDFCAHCRTRYRFDAELRRYVRVAVAEPMPAQLRERLAKLRIGL